MSGNEFLAFGFFLGWCVGVITFLVVMLFRVWDRDSRNSAAGPGGPPGSAASPFDHRLELWHLRRRRLRLLEDLRKEATRLGPTPLHDARVTELRRLDRRIAFLETNIAA